MMLTPFEKIMAQGDSTEVALSLIDPFPEHPFQVRMDEDMEELIESIRLRGVLEPVILRRNGKERYESIAGHRRCFACRQLHMETVPAVIREITDEEAVLWMVESNIQRTNILPSEKARAYRMKMEALAKQGSRTDLADGNASRQPVGKWKRETAEQVGNRTGDSGRQVQRYIRLNHLLPELLELVDRKKLSFLAGVELSYLSMESQNGLFQYLQEHACGISQGQARQVRELERDGRLTGAVLEEIFCKAGSSGKRPHRKGPYGKEVQEYRNYFPETYSEKEMKGVIRKLLEKWKKGEIQL